MWFPQRSERVILGGFGHFKIKKIITLIYWKKENIEERETVNLQSRALVELLYNFIA